MFLNKLNKPNVKVFICMKVHNTDHTPGLITIVLRCFRIAAFIKRGLFIERRRLQCISQYHNEHEFAFIRGKHVLPNVKFDILLEQYVPIIVDKRRKHIQSTIPQYFAER